MGTVGFIQDLDYCILFIHQLFMYAVANVLTYILQVHDFIKLFIDIPKDKVLDLRDEHIQDIVNDAGNLLNALLGLLRN